MGWLSWIVFGALAGWVASLIVPVRDRRSGCLFNMVIGILGALLAGFIYQAVTDRPWDYSLLVRQLRRRRPRRDPAAGDRRAGHGVRETLMRA